AQLRALGFEVSTGVGRTGVVGLLRNGKGPTVLIRTELDALPMEEKTGLPYASKVVTRNDAGVEVPVMHACGHDIHMTSWVGAATHRSIDPVLIAAKTVVSLHNIVSREINPLDPAVITVGSIHGGTKSNIIPDEAKLQITVRSYKDEVQKQLLASIARVARGEALAGGATKEPLVMVDPHGTTHSTFNDEVLTQRLANVLSRTIG